jgi:heparan-alpha-glucosaminide N-acetyltransferase
MQKFHRFSTVWPHTQWIIRVAQYNNSISTAGKTLFTTEQTLYEKGIYLVILSDNIASDPQTQINWQFVTVDRGDNIYIPIYIAVGIIFGLLLVLFISKRGYQYYKSRRASEAILDLEEESDFFYLDEHGNSVINYKSARGTDNSNSNSKFKRNNNVSSHNEMSMESKKFQAKKERLHSIDTFRGISLSIMIFVNYGGGGFTFFNHSVWNGLTVADLVFPWFIFLMGCSMAISFNSMHKQGLATRTILLKVLRRTFMLFMLGLIVSNGGAVSLSQVRVMGVLQRFSISYLVVSLIMLFVPKYQFYNGSEVKPNVVQQDNFFYPRFAEILHNLFEILTVLAIVALHVALTFGLEVPGCGKGYLGPAGPLVEGGKYADCVPGGAAGYIDRQILGINHVYGFPTSQPIFLNGSFDPEGLLGCLTSIVLVYLGLMGGRVILYYSSSKVRCSIWLVYAVIFGSIAGGLCGFTQNTGIIPINKNLWSISFILCMAAFAFINLTVLYLVVDRYKLWGGGPFMAMGLNSIVIYVGSELCDANFPFNYSPADSMRYSHDFLLYSNLLSVCTWLILANWMDHEKFYIAV